MIVFFQLPFLATRIPLYWLWNELLIGGQKRTRADRCGRERTNTDAWPMRTVSKGRIRTADGSNSMKPDGCGRRTHPLRPPQGRIRTADAQTFFPGGRKRTADAPHSSASRTDSDGGQANFLESGRRRTPDEGGRSPSREPWFPWLFWKFFPNFWTWKGICRFFKWYQSANASNK